MGLLPSRIHALMMVTLYVRPGKVSLSYDISLSLFLCSNGDNRQKALVAPHSTTILPGRIFPSSTPQKGGITTSVGTRAEISFPLFNRSLSGVMRGWTESRVKANQFSRLGGAHLQRKRRPPN
ncbi:hypothetical protein FRC16_002810, partial [Serendipita sp. 398]